MIGNRNKGWDGIVTVARMSVEFDAVGEHPPCVELDLPEIFVFAPPNGSADVTKIHWMVDYFRVQCQQLRNQEVQRVRFY